VSGFEGQQPNVVTSLGIYAAIGVILLVRYSRPMRISIARMWVGPLIFLAMTATLVWGEQQNPATAMSPAVIAIALVAGALAGIPFGLLRGRHTTVKATEKPGVMYLGPSWIVAAIWIGAFAIRAALRIGFQGTPFALPVGDGVLMLAVAMLVTSYYAIYKKYLALEHQAGQA
jgi:hypothetical protein